MLSQGQKDTCRILSFRSFYIAISLYRSLPTAFVNYTANKPDFATVTATVTATETETRLVPVPVPPSASYYNNNSQSGKISPCFFHFRHFYPGRDREKNTIQSTRCCAGVFSDRGFVQREGSFPSSSDLSFAPRAIPTLSFIFTKKRGRKCS